MISSLIRIHESDMENGLASSIHRFIHHSLMIACKWRTCHERNTDEDRWYVNTKEFPVRILAGGAVGWCWLVLDVVGICPKRSKRRLSIPVEILSKCCQMPRKCVGHPLPAFNPWMARGIFWNQGAQGWWTRFSGMLTIGKDVPIWIEKADFYRKCGSLNFNMTTPPNRGKSWSKHIIPSHTPKAIWGVPEILRRIT